MVDGIGRYENTVRLIIPVVFHGHHINTDAVFLGNRLGHLFQLCVLAFAEKPGGIGYIIQLGANLFCRSRPGQLGPKQLLSMDFEAGCAYLGEEELHLTPSEYKLLCLLCKNVGKVLTHTYITQQIWGRSWDNDVASLRVFMATLRKKLEKEPGSPQYIQTHIGVGYRMMKVEPCEKTDNGEN